MNTATEVVAPRMQALQKLEKTLKKLDLSWKVIETTARVVSPPQVAGYIQTLEHTRLAFSQLAREMVEQIAQTHLQNRCHDLAARAQVAIDMLVRNLFERTADVGFIATDAPLVGFVQAPQAGDPSALLARLQEYRDKYTVYDDILVLDAQAQVLLSLQARSSQQTMAPAWWAQLLSSSRYVEQYGASAWFPHQGPVLLYAQRILSPAGQVCGAVLLKFDLQSELASIFAALQAPDTLLLLLDAQARVLASSAPAQVAVRDGLQLPRGESSLRHQGRDYLYAHCQTRGYQGYDGPGWSAAALIGLDAAFEPTQPGATADGPGAAAVAGTQGQADIALDNPQLQHIIARARHIEEDLNRVIWNGKLTESCAVAGSALSPVFAEIGRTSQQTIAVFDAAIGELKALLLAGRRAELAAHARLAVDLMDRNLYERANDCRWWALSEELAQLLQQLQAAPAAGDVAGGGEGGAEGGAAPDAAARAAAILAHLNSLYTVYRRVALFDRQGRILAVSKDPHGLGPEAAIPAALLQRTLALQGSQSYAVSEMLPHALADGAPTYLFCAPIRRMAVQAGAQPCLGGIALAFNCADELQAMLQDSLPAGGATSAFFVDPSGRVLSRTQGTGALEPAVAVGERPACMAQLLANASMPLHAASSPHASPASALCEWHGRTYLAGVALSQGYREFKTSDGYRDAVYSVLLSPVDLSPLLAAPLALPQRAGDGAAPASHYGVVQCGRLLFGLASEQVIEAVAVSQLSAAPVASQSVGLLSYSQDGKSTLLAVYDACVLTGQQAIADPSQAVAIVVRRADQHIALLVDRLIDVIASDPASEPPGGINPRAPWISGYIHDQQAGSEPVFTLDPGALALA